VAGYNGACAIPPRFRPRSVRNRAPTKAVGARGRSPRN
jgi:hypothetical protein